MNAKDIKATIANLHRSKYQVEVALEENGGELTPEILEQLDIMEDMKVALSEGVDDLGRWLKSVQDEISARKAEADAAARKVKNLKGYEEYIKFLVGQALDAIGEEKVKGDYYGFTRTTSTKSAVDQEMLDALYLARAEKAMLDAGIPEYIHPVLKTTTTDLKAAGEEAAGLLDVTSEPAIRFTKPRANKE